MIANSNGVKFTSAFHEVQPSDILTKEYWEEVVRSKELFLKLGENPRKNHFVRPEVAESWIRSRELGQKPSDSYADCCLEESEFQQVQKMNALFIEVATPLMYNFMELATASGYTLELFDKNGAFLIGSHQPWTKYDVRNYVWNEGTSGATGHVLAMYHKKPFQLIGPEHYLDVLINVISSAAPILDENNEVIGALALVQEIGSRKPWEQNLHNLQSHALGWIGSLAAAIESQIMLNKSNYSLSSVNSSLSKANQLLGVTLEYIDEGIVTIEPDGTIVRMNHEGARILRISDLEQGHNITEYLSKKSSLMDTLNSKKNVDYIEEVIKNDQSEQHYLVSIRLVMNTKSTDVELAILRFSHPDKINALVASRSGASAKFNLEDIIGESESLHRAKKLAHRFARTKENILLLGESGTGKELFAQSIHSQYRPEGPFVAINCAAMPRNLIESELFGYESGAFTGAEKNGRPGKIELANGGTLFLDEIGDMPYELQSVLLRVLQDKQVMRLGGKRYIQVDFRLIAATNQNLLQVVQAKSFREDLYFRLSVLNIEIPPLRDRGYDINILAEYFVKQYARRMGWTVPVISTAARKKILEYNWPGNVRQLENAIIYAVNLAEDGIIDLHHLPNDVLSNYELVKTDIAVSQNTVQKSSKEPKDIFSMKDSEKNVIQKALLRAGNSVAVAAKLLGISKTTLYRKLKEHDITF